MSSRWLVRTAAAIGVATVTFIGAAPAWAATDNIPLHEAHEGSTAANFQQDCADEKFDEQGPNQDAWLFVLPDEAWDFTKVTLNFEDGDGDPVQVVIDAVDPASDSGPGWEGFITVSPGTSKLILFTEAGWTLVDGNADITGPDEDETIPADFVLSHTCAGTPPTTAPPTSPPAESSPPVETSPPASSGPPDLPETGLALGGLITVAAGLVIGGTLLLIARRRRDGATDGGAISS